MTRVPDYSYTSYLRATATQVWDALTDPETTGRYWGHRQVSTWRVGDPVEHVRVDGSGIADAGGRVLEADAPRRLSFTFGDPGAEEEPGRRSVVAFDIEEGAGIVRLTITHTELPSPEDRAAVEIGWPAVFSNLKTLLETGEVLPQEPWTFED